MDSNNKFQFIDSHIHIRGVDNAGIKQTFQGISAIKEQLGMDAINVAAIPQWDPDSVGQMEFQCSGMLVIRRIIGLKKNVLNMLYRRDGAMQIAAMFLLNSYIQK